jgi:hypothetical protein
MMAMLRGIETLAIGKTKVVEIEYAGKGYVDRRGQKVSVEDIICFGCSNAYFSLSEDPIDYCPHCGRREASPWNTLEEARAWARAFDFGYMSKFSLLPLACQRPEGFWVLGFARSVGDVLALGRYADVREIRV